MGFHAMEKKKLGEVTEHVNNYGLSYINVKHF